MASVERGGRADDWEAPFPYGFPAAIENAGSVAAPLLAGFSFTFVALVLPAPVHFRWPSVVLTLVVGAGICFIASVQCGFWARQYAITPVEITTWRPDYPRERQLAIQRLHQRGFAIWMGRFNLVYRLAILLLLAGLTLALVPSGSIGPIRYLAIAVAGAGFVGEALWVAAGVFLRGSPGTAYDDQPDEPRQGVRFLRLRRARPLRRVARWFVPLVRIRLPASPEDDSEGPAAGS